MELIGKLYKVLDEQTGQGRNGQWKKISFVLEIEGNFPKMVCLDAWSERVDQVKQFQVGQTLKVEFDLESREYNGRWYTNAKAWKLEVAGQPAGGDMPPLPSVEDLPPESDDAGDLPF
jgi:hypothetical protein